MSRLTKSRLTGNLFGLSLPVSIADPIAPVIDPVIDPVVDPVDPVTPSAGVTMLSGANGQSELVNGNIDNVATEQLGVYPRVSIMDASASGYPVSVLSIVPAGETIGAVTGPASEPNNGGSASIIGTHGFATLDDGYLPDENTMLTVKRAASGTPHSGWVIDGSNFNGSDGAMASDVDTYVRANDTRAHYELYYQSSGDASTATASTASLAEALTYPDVANWAADHVETIRARREYYKIMDLPYIFVGANLAPIGGPYANDQQRVREVTENQKRNIARWQVDLNEAGDGIVVTDLGLNRVDIAWDFTNDEPIFTDSGEASPYKDDSVYFINPRGYESPDDLHPSWEFKVAGGVMMRHLMEHIYGAGGNAPASHALEYIAPIFYASPSVANETSEGFDVALTASQVGTAHVGVYPAGTSQPSAADLIAGTGALATASFSTSRRNERSTTITGLSGLTDYEVFAVIVQDDRTSVVSAGVTATTLSAGASAPVNTLAPSISGLATAGEALTATNGNWQAEPAPTYAYQWTRDGVAIVGAISSTYTLVVADEGYGIGVTVTATNSEASTIAESEPVGRIAPLGVYAPTITSAPVITAPDGATTDDTATLSSFGTWGGGGNITYAIEWTVYRTAVSGETAETYAFRSSDATQEIEARVTATNEAGSSFAYSNVIIPVAGEVVTTAGWSLVGSQTAQIESQDTEGDTVTLTLPAGIAENDVVMIFAAGDIAIDQNTANQGAATEGYTQEYTFGGNPGAYIAWKRQGATPDPTVDIYMRNKRQSVAVQVWRGADTSTLLDVPIVEDVGTGATPDPASLTTVTAGALRVVVGFLDDDDASTVTAPTGYTDLAFTGTSIGNLSGAAGGTIMVASKVADVAGAEDPDAFVTDGNDSWRTIHMALRPA